MDFTNAQSQTLGIDLSGSSAESSIAPIPVGQYGLRLDAITDKVTKDNTGKYLKAEFRVVGGPCEDRVIFQNFNYINQNSDAVRIGQQQLKQFMLAAGGNPNKPLTMDDLTALLGREVQAKVGLEKGQGEYGDQNKVLEFFSRDGLKVTDQGLVPVGGAAAQQAPAPWTQIQQPAAPAQAPAQPVAAPVQAPAPVAQVAPPQAAQPPAAVPAGRMPWEPQAAA